MDLNTVKVQVLREGKAGGGSQEAIVIASDDEAGNGGVQGSAGGSGDNGRCGEAGGSGENGDVRGGGGEQGRGRGADAGKDMKERAWHSRYGTSSDQELGSGQEGNQHVGTGSATDADGANLSGDGDGNSSDGGDGSASDDEDSHNDEDGGKKKEGDEAVPRTRSRTAPSVHNETKQEPGPFYRAVADHDCGADGRTRGECMARVLRKLRRSPGVQVAYLQKCVGIGDASAFKELIGLITEHPGLWAVNLGELSGTLTTPQQTQLLGAIARSDIVCTYYDQGSTGSPLPKYCRDLKDAILANRTKHTRWICGIGGEGDEEVIRGCTHMFKHPRTMYPNSVVLNDKRRQNVSYLAIQMNAACATGGLEARREEASAFEEEAATTAESLEAYSQAMQAEIERYRVVSERRCEDEAEREMDSVPEEDEDPLREALDDLDLVLDYDQFLETEVAAYEKFGTEMFGRTAIENSKKGSKWRDRVLKKAADLAKGRSSSCLDKMKKYDMETKHDGGISEKSLLRKVRAREVIVVGIWKDAVRGGKPGKQAVDPELSERARAISERLDGNTKSNKPREKKRKGASGGRDRKQKRGAGRGRGRGRGK